MNSPTSNRKLDKYQRGKYRSAQRCFNLAGLLVLVLSLHDYALLTQFEEQEKRISLSSFFAELYAAAGKWGVVGYDLAMASLVFAGSLYCLWRLRTSARTSF